MSILTTSATGEHEAGRTTGAMASVGELRAERELRTDTVARETIESVKEKIETKIEEKTCDISSNSKWLTCYLSILAILLIILITVKVSAPLAIFMAVCTVICLIGAHLTSEEILSDNIKIPKLRMLSELLVVNENVRNAVLVHLETQREGEIWAAYAEFNELTPEWMASIEIGVFLDLYADSDPLDDLIRGRAMHGVNCIVYQATQDLLEEAAKRGY